MNSSFRSIVQQVTREKLEELKLQKNLMTDHFEPVLNQIAEPSISPVNSLQTLYKAIRDNPVKDIIDSILVENLKYVLQNAEDDPSISSQLVLAWIEKVTQEIQYSLRKCEYSYLYGSLLSEWLEVEERKSAQKSTAVDSDGADLSSELDDKIQLSASAVIDKIKGLMFKEVSSDEFDQKKFRKFLSEELFQFEDNAEGQSVMKALRKETEEYFKIDSCYITSYDVQCCIKGLRSEDLLSSEKKAALKELSENSEAQEEVASLLTNRMRNLSRWDWPSSCKSVEIRRGLAGEYKPFINEDIITALFLQYVGVQWASYFKRQFLKLYRSKVWIKTHCHDNSIESERRRFHERTFLSSLPDSMESQDSKHQDEYAKIEASDIAYDCQIGIEAFGQQQGSLFGSSNAPQNTNTFAFGGRRVKKSAGLTSSRQQPQHLTPASSIDFKQAFLHNLSTEIRLHQVIHSDKPLVVLQADLESFGPSVIHDAVLTALEHLGVSEEWIGFFKKFLQPKVYFAEKEVPKTILRGVPTSHVLSSLFGETLLFLLDFFVNQKCNGMRIYRISDEFWFWSEVTENVTKAWETMNSYGKMVGLKIKENRSGSAAVYSDQMLSKLENSIEFMCGPNPLPQKNIHWGYLELHSNGTFKIDQKAIKKFLREMQVLLNKSECVLEWINVFNKYMAFFIRNFGKCALVSGRQHLDQIVSSLRMIYVGLFGSENGSPVEQLKTRFDQLKAADIVDVWAYWPLERGGLGLVNPFIGIMSLRESYVDINDDDHFSKLPLEDKVIYEEMKKEFERTYGKVDSDGSLLPRIGTVFPVPQKLPTWTEYLSKRESELSHWHCRYIQLLHRPDPKTPLVSDRFWKLDGTMPEGEIERNYMMWLFTYYETQLVLHFGSPNFINSKLLPMSMIANIQKSKVQH